MTCVSTFYIFNVSGNIFSSLVSFIDNHYILHQIYVCYRFYSREFVVLTEIGPEKTPIQGTEFIGKRTALKSEFTLVFTLV